MIRSLPAILLCTIVLHSNLFANNYATPGTGVKWTLDQLVANSGGDVTFSSGAYMVNDTIFISKNDTLSITVDATVKFAASTYFDINGVLIINPPTGVLFTAQNIATRYHGMRIDSSSGSRLNKLTFEYGNSLRLFDCSPLIENCIFRNTAAVTTFGNAAISLFRSNAIINNCQFLNNQRAAIQGGANIANAPRVTGCLFQGNNTLNQNVPQINLGTSGTDTVYIINNQLLRASTNSGGIGFLPIGNVYAVIKNNTIKNNRYGLTFNGGSNINVIVAYNRVDSNNTQGDPNLGGSGIAFAGGTATSQQNAIVTGNTFTANLWGITIQNRSRPNLGNLNNADTSDDGKNWFINNTNNNTPGIDVYNNSVDTIFAQGNFWGSNDPVVMESKVFHLIDNPALGPIIPGLPVFISFTGTPVGDDVKLDWRSTYHYLSAFFTVERSTDGIRFDSIGFVDAVFATTYTNNDHTFTDQNVQYFNRPVYYRLKIRNQKRYAAYSQVITVTVPRPSSDGLVRIYPTIFTYGQQLTAEITSSSDQSVTMNVFDMLGRRIYQRSLAVLTGTNRLPVTIPLLQPAGWLLVKIEGDGIKKTIPLLQQ